MVGTTAMPGPASSRQSPSTILDEVAVRNDEACRTVESHDYDRAICVYTALLSTSKAVMDSFADGTADCQLSPATTSLDAGMLPSSLPMRTARDVAGTGAYVYRHPIRLPQGLQRTYGNCVLISTVIMFNLGLCHHLKACCNRDLSLSTTCLEKAGRLYELCYNLQLEENLDDGHGNVYFTMTTVNNLGMIHSVLGRHEVAERCFRHLLSAVVFLVDQKEAGLSTMDGFIQNTCFLVIRQNTAAAA